MVGLADGICVGDVDGVCDGLSVGLTVGFRLGRGVGSGVVNDGFAEGTLDAVGLSVDVNDGDCVCREVIVTT